MWRVLLFFVAGLLLAEADVLTHRYKKGEPVVLWTNKGFFFLSFFFFLFSFFCFLFTRVVTFWLGTYPVYLGRVME
jgi:hypothetical protein